ncbi:MAG: barstar family protein [Nostocoides sp.]
MISDVTGAVDIVALIRSARDKDRDVRLVPAGATKAESLAHFAASLAFPHWFGGNLDALADSLTTMVRESARPVEVIWDGVRTLENEDHDAYVAIRAVLADVNDAEDGLHVTAVHRL